MLTIEFEDLIFDAKTGGYWLKPPAQRVTKGRCQSPAEVAFWQAASVQLPGLVRQFHAAGDARALSHTDQLAHDACKRLLASRQPRRHASSSG